MTSYIGTPTSRVDGRAKVTGAAQYAGEFNVPGLAYGSVVTSTIAKGRIARIDTSEALAVEGVLDVLTHENRPKMAGTDKAYHDDVAPGGSPFRPLYDDKIKFNGQPIALVLAEEWEIARFAASLVRVEYERETHATDLHARLDDGLRGRKAGEAAWQCRRRPMPPPKCGTRPSISSRSSITIRWSCLPRRWSGTATANSRSTTRRRACRTCSATSAASSA